MSVLNNEGLEYYDGKSKERLNNALDKKVDKIAGKGLSSNDYTTTEKNKLAGIATGANKTTVDSALSSSSTNPVQNKVVNSALSEKANISHTHTKSQITDFPTSMPASDVSAWAKASSKPSYTKSEVGLGNVDNTADENKNVKSSTKLQTYKQGSTTETYGNSYPVYAQWTDSSHVKMKCDNYTVETDYATSAGSATNASKVNNHTVESDVPANAKFTDTTYSSKAATSGGTDVSLVTTGEKAIWNAKTSNAGTITGIKMNGASKGTSGVVDLGTVLTGGKQSTTSTADGGLNVYTFSDGSTITVKNGSKGSSGTNGSNGTSAAWFTGTAVTGTSTTATSFSVSGSKTGDMYLNTSTYNVYRASASNSWVYVCNIKGASGTNGTNGTTPTIKAASGSNIGSVGTPSVSASTSGTTTTFTFNYLKGATGATGTRGTALSLGTAITGTSTTATIFSGSGLTSSLVNDVYLNTSTFNMYKCTVAGNAATAKWIYIGCIKGANGTNATTTSVATTSSNGLMSKDMVTKLNGIATGANAYTLPTASASVLGGIKVGTNLSISNGVLSASSGNKTVYQSTEPTGYSVNDSWLQEY